VGYLLEVIDVGSDLDHDTMLKSEVMALEPGHPAEEIGLVDGQGSRVSNDGSSGDDSSGERRD
jgi:hypothetical protein